MTPQELLALIQSDTEALAMANAGNDAGCAERCKAIATKVHDEMVLTEKGLYHELGAVFAETVLQKMQAFAAAEQSLSPVVARFLRWLEPKNGGAPFGQSETLEMLDALYAGSVFTAEERDAIREMSLVEQTITASDVSEAMRGSRNG